MITVYSQFSFFCLLERTIQTSTNRMIPVMTRTSVKTLKNTSVRAALFKVLTVPIKDCPRDKSAIDLESTVPISLDTTAAMKKPHPILYEGSEPFGAV